MVKMPMFLYVKLGRKCYSVIKMQKSETRYFFEKIMIGGMRFFYIDKFQEVRIEKVTKVARFAATNFLSISAPNGTA